MGEVDNGRNATDGTRHPVSAFAVHLLVYRRFHDGTGRSDEVTHFNVFNALLANSNNSVLLFSNSFENNSCGLFYLLRERMAAASRWFLVEKTRDKAQEILGQQPLKSAIHPKRNINTSVFRTNLNQPGHLGRTTGKSAALAPVKAQHSPKKIDIQSAMQQK